MRTLNLNITVSGNFNIFKTLIKTLGVVLVITFVSLSSLAQSFVLNLQGQSMRFTNAQRTILLDMGNDGENTGSVHKYSNIITKDGITVYAKLTILDKHNADITNFDDDAITGDAFRFQPRIGTTASDGGYIVYQLEFFNTANDQSVFLYNYNLTAVDIDGENSGNREFVEAGGYTAYTVNNPTGLTVTTNNITGRTKFRGISYSLGGITFENSAAMIANYLNPNNIITFVLGQTAKNAERFYSVQLGVAGGVFSLPVVVPNPLPVAVDDNGTPVNSATGGVAVPNVLDNDLYNALPVVPSQVTISLVTPASNPGIVLNTSTGAVTVAPGTPGGDYTLVYKICMVASPSDCDIAIVTVRALQADLAITKTVIPNPVVAGQNITYTITVLNNGPTEATGVKVQDILSDDLVFVSATPSFGTWLAPEWNIGVLANGASVNMTIVATVKPAFSGILGNTAIVSSPTSDPNLNNNTSMVNVNVNPLITDADVQITKTVSQSPVISGQGVAYTIVVKNNGPASALNVTATDVLSANLTFVGATASLGTSWVAPSWTIGTLANGATVTLTIIATVNDGFTGTINNTAAVTSSTPDPNLLNNSASVSLTVNPSVPIVNHYPASGPGTLAFEDLWPSKGDYDFNDMVIDYQFEIITNSFNLVDQLKCTFTLKAFGAYFHNGFGFQLPAAILASDLTVTGYSLSSGYVTLSGNGTESGQSKATIIVFDDAYRLMPHPGNGTGVNTEQAAPYVTPVTLQITIDFKPDTYSYFDLDIAHFNPFIIVNQNRNVEVHLPDYPPTSLVDQSLLGTQDDKSIPSTGKYYKTQNNLPWAINIYESFAYPLEKVDVTSAHLHFVEWATSGGQSYPDWYQDKPGYRNNSLVY